MVSSSANVRVVAGEGLKHTVTRQTAAILNCSMLSLQLTAMCWVPIGAVGRKCQQIALCLVFGSETPSSEDFKHRKHQP